MATTSATPIRRMLCSNTIVNSDGTTTTHCQHTYLMICSGCYLVRYCGKECQTADRLEHKKDCMKKEKNEKAYDLASRTWKPTWWRVRYEPSFLNELFLAGNFAGQVTGYDVINMATNEDGDNIDHFAVLFAANGDLRNVIASVNGIPKGHAAPITCVINTQDPTYMGQSLLLLLVAMSFSPRIACEIMTHLWYSARLTGNMVALVSEKLRPLIAAVVENCKDSGEDDLVKKIFTFGTSSLCVHLEKEKWVSMLALFDFDHGKAQTEANRKRVMLDGEYLDYRERHLFNLSPSRRLSTQRMRETGVLLPFGTLLDDFSCPNPTLFDTKTGSWLLNHSSDPMSSWPLDEVIVSGLYHGVPKEDLYGHLYFHVRDQCELFCYNLAKTIVDFHFYNQDVTHLRSVLKDTLSPHVDSGFDRIDASTIADTIGIQRTLLALGPLLQTPEQKPDAVLITQHLEAMTEAQATLDSTYLISSLTEREWGIINQCADMEAVNQDRASIHEGLLYVLPSYLRLFGALEIVRDYDRLFGIWLVNVLGFDNVCVATGMEIGGPNIIVDAWPTRMKKHAGEEGAQEEFNIILQSASKGKERVVEWIRAYPGSSHWDEIVAKEEKEKVGYAESSAGKKPEVSKDEAAGSEKWAWEK